MMKPLFNKVLIANRGEIARRVIRTLREMKIKSVAVYSEADSNSLYVQEADEAIFIGDAPVTESYLNIKKIIGAIRASGAEAVHPGYGFLSENPVFANSLKREGVILIGPSSHAIRAMGDKIEAKKIAIDAGVSTVPGYMGSIATVEQAIEIAGSIGFPVIVKAAAGGGGRGMRVVYDKNQMADAYDATRREAANHFSDSRVFIEKFIEKPRHIEIQLLADQHGNAICLGERECSIQRHHQKVIEEAPSPFIDEPTRQEMYRQVVMLAQKVGYYSAGTVEFIVDQNKNFFFLEMNTRLQVEHPVTELITGIDLVEQMVRVAAGEQLAFTQNDIKLEGWAFECRICSEDPSKGFMPSSGRITQYEEPPKGPNIRVDSGVGPGSEVSMFYDSMIAKLCTYDITRAKAIDHMRRALGSFVLKGVSHNMSFLEAIITNPRFASGDMSTNFISEEYPDGFSGANLTIEMTEVFISVAIHVFMAEQKRSTSIADQMIHQSSKIGTRWVVRIDNQNFPVMIKPVADGYNIRHSLGRIYVRTNWVLGSSIFTGIVNGRNASVKVERITSGVELTHSGTSAEVYVRSPRVSELESIMPEKKKDSASAAIKAPLTGEIIEVRAEEGKEVKEGDVLAILTAMKMENVITAKGNAKVSKVHVGAGDQVTSGQVIIEFEEDGV
jgi:propionyl-CoA carboxylase alpha chain